MKLTLVLAMFVVCSGAFASEPGNPLDCSDWVILEPGISCVTYVPYPCSNGQGGYLQACGSPGFTDERMDHTGSIFNYEEVGLGSFSCGCTSGQRRRYQVYRLGPYGEKTVVAYAEQRCPGPTATGPDSFAESVGLTFDKTNGRLFMFGASSCLCFNCTSYPYGKWRIALEGFTTTFEILQTYTPQASFGFRVPYMPEGVAAADSFDTYWGSLSKPLDFAQAHPLKCDYPAAQPQVGDYLTVNDPLPNPEPGTGRYYVTSATYQGATRYGRRATAGQLSGRDPALLPACVTP